MPRSEPTKEDYHSPIYKLATLESELGQARKLLEMPPDPIMSRESYAYYP